MICRRFFSKALILTILTTGIIFSSCTNSLDNNSNTEDTEKQPFDRPDDSGNPDGGQNNQPQKESTTYTANASTRNLLAADDVSTIVFTDTVYINLGEGADSSSSFSTDGNEYAAITAAKKKAAQTVIENVLIYKTSDGVVTLNTEEYTGILKVILSGKIEHGSFAMKTSAGYTGLFLDNAEITSGNYPPIEIKGDVEKTYVVLSGSNSLTDGRKYGTGYSEEEGTDYYTSSFTGTPDSEAELTTKWACFLHKRLLHHQRRRLSYNH